MTNGLNGYEAIYKDEVIHEIAAGILRFAPVREESTPTLNPVNVQHTPISPILAKYGLMVYIPSCVKHITSTGDKKDFLRIFANRGLRK